MEQMDLSGLNLSEKEEKILQSAIQVFSEKGFSAATTSEIAKNAGIAEGTIFRYFKTKKDILRGILIQTIKLASGKVVMDGVEKIFSVSEGKDLRSILKELIYDRLKLVDSFFPMARVIITEAIYHEDVREALYENIILKILDIFKEFHLKMVERGLIRSGIEPILILRSALGNIFLLIAQRKVFGEKMQIIDFEAEVDKMIDVLLYGIAPSKTGEKSSGRINEGVGL